MQQSEADQQPDGDWRTYGRTQFGQCYSPLKQITPANAGKLQLAWTFDTGVNGLQVTPLVVNGIMYVTSANDAFALDARVSLSFWCGCCLC